MRIDGALRLDPIGSVSRCCHLRLTISCAFPVGFTTIVEVNRS